MKRGGKNNSYTVGYGKPPHATRFKKGQSGNPAGRPRKPLDLAPSFEFTESAELVLQDAMRVVIVREGGKQRKITMEEAILRSLGVAALKGNVRAQNTYLKRVAEARSQQLQEKLELLETLEHLRKFGLKAIADAQRQGLPEPQLFPHPHDIFIDWRTGEYRVEGPRDESEAAKWAEMQTLRQNAQRCIAELKSMKPLNREEEESILQRIADWESVCAAIDAGWPDEQLRRREDYDPEVYLRRADIAPGAPARKRYTKTH
jgi:hypothetical protein